MAFHIRDRAIGQAVRRLARLRGNSLKETVREPADHAYARENSSIPLINRLQAIHGRFAALRRPRGFPADKAFFDDLSGDR
jgi:hypothetical protein